MKYDFPGYIKFWFNVLFDITESQTSLHKRALQYDLHIACFTLIKSLCYSKLGIWSEPLEHSVVGVEESKTHTKNLVAQKFLRQFYSKHKEEERAKGLGRKHHRLELRCRTDCRCRAQLVQQCQVQHTSRVSACWLYFCKSRGRMTDKSLHLGSSVAKMVPRPELFHVVAVSLTIELFRKTYDLTLVAIHLLCLRDSHKVQSFRGKFPSVLTVLHNSFICSFSFCILQHETVGWNTKAQLFTRKPTMADVIRGNQQEAA